VDISVDESYKPVIEEEKKVFDSSFPDAKVIIHYKPEAACIKDLLEKKSLLILVTRDLSADENKVCEQNKIAPYSLAVAEDAVSIIVNLSSPDSTLTPDQLNAILTGEYKNKYTVVFDNSSSSAMRYINDSLLLGRKMGTNVFAAKSNEEAVEYVHKNPNALGIVGLSYISDTADPANTGSFIKTVRVVGMQNKITQEFYQPYLGYIAYHFYPFTRKLYYINGVNYLGVARTFANFLASPRGQLIFKQAHLFPQRMEIEVRQAELNNNQH